jgi:hypothetical protein
MPKFLEKKLKEEYGEDKHAIYGTMNKLGFMKGNKETKKGEKAEEKHEAKTAALHKKKK